MKNFFSIIIIFAVLLVGGGYVWVQKQDEAKRQKIEEGLSAARRGFAARARDAASQADDEAYVRQMKAALSGYRDELKRTLYTPYPEAKDVEKFKKTVEKKFQAAELGEAERKSMLEGYDIVREAYEVLEAGTWKPVLTAKGSADTRLDIYALRRTTDEDGAPILEGKFFFWGIEDSTVVSWGDLNMRLWKKDIEKVKEGKKMVDKEVEMVLGRAEGESQPRVIIQRPHKYIDDFPAFVSVGHIWLPVLPADAVYVDIEYIYRTKTGGADVESVLKWEKIEIPRGWKLGEGQDWEADEIEATEEEIRGVDPNAEQAKANE